MPRRSVLAVALVATFALASCGDDDGGGGDGSGDTAEQAASTTTAPAPLQILVTNDDGVAGEGMDLLVQELDDIPDVEVTVVAPAENQSGTGDRTTEGEIQYDDAELASGTPATAVDGFPADSVNVAIQELALEPDLVVAGVNEGQNEGVLASVSGTVGAAATAARQGIPAVAVSQGLADPLDYASGVEAAVTWITEHLDEYESGEADPLVNINVPTCATGELRGTVEVPAATESTGTELDPVDCTSTLEDPANDTEAFSNGFVAVSVLDPETLQ